VKLSKEENFPSVLMKLDPFDSKIHGNRRNHAQRGWLTNSEKFREEMNSSNRALYDANDG
jgi:hypothetical protein